VRCRCKHQGYGASDLKAGGGLGDGEHAHPSPGWSKLSTDCADTFPSDFDSTSAACTMCVPTPSRWSHCEGEGGTGGPGWRERPAVVEEVAEGGW
jgi:hypothetical protein